MIHQNYQKHLIGGHIMMEPRAERISQQWKRMNCQLLFTFAKEWKKNRSITITLKLERK
jgi:hypothetical protein